MPEAPASITTLIAHRRMCLSCLATSAGMSTGTVEAVIDVIRHAIILRREAAECDHCGALRVVYQLDRA